MLVKVVAAAFASRVLLVILMLATSASAFAFNPYPSFVTPVPFAPAGVISGTGKGALSATSPGTPSTERDDIDHDQYHPSQSRYSQY